MKRYRAILFIRNTVLAKLGARGAGALWDARLRQQGSELVLIGSGGATSVVPWPTLRDAAALGHLPAPTCAFRLEPDGDAVGLLFESNAPLPGLRYQEPHSLIPSLGWLTEAGLRDQP